MLWLQVDGLNNQLRSLLKYLPTPRASCFSTQGIQIDDPNNALSYFSILIHVISSMHITHLYLHFEVILKMKYAHIGKFSHQDQYNIWMNYCPYTQGVVLEFTAAFCLKPILSQSIQLIRPSAQYLPVWGFIHNSYDFSCQINNILVDACCLIIHDDDFLIECQFNLTQP